MGSPVKTGNLSALARFGGRLLDDHKFCESWQEHTSFLSSQYIRYALLCYFVDGSDLLDPCRSPATMD
jgi:hypothetical protein